MRLLTELVKSGSVDADRWSKRLDSHPKVIEDSRVKKSDRVHDFCSQDLEIPSVGIPIGHTIRCGCCAIKKMMTMSPSV
jgi:hypothetical protein